MSMAWAVVGEYGKLWLQLEKFPLTYSVNLIIKLAIALNRCKFEPISIINAFCQAFASNAGFE